MSATRRNKNIRPARDKLGYLVDLACWNEAIARLLASELSIELTDAHWEIIHAVRAYYQKFDSAPASRALIKWIGLKLGKDKGNSIYVMALFPGSPAKSIAKIAGLPRPANCI